MSVARKRRRYLRWLRYGNKVGWQYHGHGCRTAGYRLSLVAPEQRNWLWVELS